MIRIRRIRWSSWQHVRLHTLWIKGMPSNIYCWKCLLQIFSNILLVHILMHLNVLLIENAVRPNLIVEIFPIILSSVIEDIVYLLSGFRFLGATWTIWLFPFELEDFHHSRRMSWPARSCVRLFAPPFVQWSTRTCLQGSLVNCFLNSFYASLFRMKLCFTILKFDTMFSTVWKMFGTRSSYQEMLYGTKDAYNIISSIYFVAAIVGLFGFAGDAEVGYGCHSLTTS